MIHGFSKGKTAKDWEKGCRGTGSFLHYKLGNGGIDPLLGGPKIAND